MPKYFFNILNGDKVEHADELGQELSSRAAAWEIATRYAGESLSDLDGKLRTDADWRLEVVTEDGVRVFQITIHADEFQRE